MVKNMKGGNKQKKMSRKNNMMNEEYNEEEECYLRVSVIKSLGDNRFYVIMENRKQLICHIPHKFSGRNKQNNFVQVNNLILVSLRPYENPAIHCDFLKILNNNTPHNFFLDFYNNNIDFDFNTNIHNFNDTILFNNTDIINI
jgi:translation initiation factor IF-1